MDSTKVIVVISSYYSLFRVNYLIVDYDMHLGISAVRKFCCVASPVFSSFRFHAIAKKNVTVKKTPLVDQLLEVKIKPSFCSLLSTIILSHSER